MSNSESNAIPNCRTCGASIRDPHGAVHCFAEFKRQIIELRVELSCERAIIKQMRQMAYDARAKVSTIIFGVEQLALSDEQRVAESGAFND
jgi:hypothetical protein